MSYFVEYRNSHYFGMENLDSKVYKEAIVIENDFCWVIWRNIEWCSDALIRTYIIDVQNKKLVLSKEELFHRYVVKNYREDERMATLREQMIVDEIKEEMDGYSDDSLFNITSFGTDMTFRELITMYEEGDLEKPEMQRNYVWNKNEASRFIDSVLLGLPVPSIFLAKTKDEKRLIVDGYQRIMTVYDYVQRGIFGGDGKSFALSNSEIINKRWRGKTFQELQPEEKRRIRNFPIHAIVFEQKEPQDDTGMYQIFERINTGGRTLKPQEIRNCVYHGDFNKLLVELNKNANWRKIYNDGVEDTRMADIELILRMFAFGYIYSQEEIQQKQINLVKYLNQIIYVFLTIFLYLLKCPQSLILSALRAFCFCGKPHISRSIFLYFLYQTWLKSW
ncbi:DUF262 domain-containing protein [Blautia producta]|uniref:DUF262 domain-containing protein n=1 Tax=Blautia producta TaxID=33035 RepID=UPI00210965FE|nr:DUF262 domain-containing protein [Blautia producta]MCQ5098288.1 DUF262 domain-containing protein [Blautia producta]